jgi:hypothetical protein
MVASSTKNSIMIRAIARVFAQPTTRSHGDHRGSAMAAAPSLSPANFPMAPGCRGCSSSTAQLNGRSIQHVRAKFMCLISHPRVRRLGVWRADCATAGTKAGSIGVSLWHGRSLRSRALALCAGAAASRHVGGKASRVRDGGNGTGRQRSRSGPPSHSARANARPRSGDLRSIRSCGSAWRFSCWRCFGTCRPREVRPGSSGFPRTGNSTAPARSTCGLDNIPASSRPSTRAPGLAHAPKRTHWRRALAEAFLRIWRRPRSNLAVDTGWGEEAAN